RHGVSARPIVPDYAVLRSRPSDRLSMTRERVDLSLIAEEAAEALLPLAEKHGVDIESYGDVAPALGSHALLLQMVTNLVNNAIVYNLSGDASLQIQTAIRPAAVQLTVEDSGEPLTPQLAATPTEPCQRGTAR